MSKNFPPNEAVIAQLSTIRAIIAPTIDMFEQTEDPETIQTNLDMIERAVQYLRGTVIEDPVEPAPQIPFTLVAADGSTIVTNNREDNVVEITIEGTDVEPTIIHPELFGDEIENVSEVNLTIPVTCGKRYFVSQTNDVLEFYKDDPSVLYDEETGTWTKTKEYYMNRDEFEYAFLTSDMRNQIIITVSDDAEQEILQLVINTHIHYKETE